VFVLKINKTGMLNKLNSKIDNTINFCWCLSFILFKIRTKNNKNSTI